MRASLSLPRINVAAGWRDHNIPIQKWQCRCGKVLPIVQNPDSNAFSIHCLGTQHTDWVRYGKVVPEFFQGSINSDTILLSMLIRVDKHPQLLAGPACIYIGRSLCSRCSRTGVHSLGAKPRCRLCIGDGP